MKKLLLILILLIFSLDCYGQSISLFDLDTINYPILKAKIYAFDKDGIIQAPSITDLKLKENNTEIKIESISCPNVSRIKAISSVLVVDISYSMDDHGAGITPFIDLAKISARAWVNALPLGKSECAITSFDNSNYLNQDFTTNRVKLIDAINSLKTKNGTDFNAALINKEAGALQLMQNSKYKKVIVMLTDGQGKCDENAIIDEAKKQNCKIYCVTLGMLTPNSLKNICRETNGEYFENITKIEDAVTVYLNILNKEQEATPCEISWKSNSSCGTKTYQNSLKWQNINTYFEYNVKQLLYPFISLSTDVVAFNRVKPGAIRKIPVTVNASQIDIVIEKIESVNGSNKFKVETPLPITIPANTNRDIVFTFSPDDSSFNTTIMEIKNNYCSMFINLSGGYLNSGGTSGGVTNGAKLKLIKPNGGENFSIGTDTEITWDGINPKTFVNIDLSRDSGKTWENIVKKVNGLNYNWKNILKPESNNCLIKLTSNLTKSNTTDSVQIPYIARDYVYNLEVSPDGKTIAFSDGNYLRFVSLQNDVPSKGIKAQDNGISCLAYSPNGKYIATCSNYSTLNIYDLTADTLIMTTGALNQIPTAVKFSPDGSKVVTSGLDKTIKVIDAISGKLLSTLVGHTAEVNCICFVGNKNILISGGSDNKLIFWNLSNSKIIKSIQTTSKIFAVAYSDILNQIAYGGNSNNVNIMDIDTYSNLFTLSGHTSFINAIKFDKIGSYVASASGDKTAIIWNMDSQNAVQKLVGHTLMVSTLDFTNDNSNIITGSYDKSVRIWNIKEDAMITDISDNVFSISIPKYTSSDVDILKCYIGEEKDSIFKNLLINTGIASFKIDSVYFEGVDANAFKFVSNNSQITVQSSLGYNSEVRFIPNKIGLHYAQIIMIIGKDTVKQNIVGEGIEQELAIINNNIDFGLVEIGQDKLLFQSLTLKNISSKPVNIYDLIKSGPNNRDFTIITPQTNFILQANDTLKLDLQFSPKSIGRTSCKLDFVFNNIGQYKSVNLFGTGLGGKAKIKLDTIEAKSGVEIEYPIKIYSNLQLINSKVTSFNIEIGFNKTLLTPTNVAKTNISGTDMVVSLENLPYTPLAEQTLFNIKFNTALGNVDETNIYIKNIELFGDDAELIIDEGQFKLLGVCKDGGERLLNGNVKTDLLFVSPNPANENLQVSYENADDGYAELSLVNILGETVQVLQIYKTQNGNANIDLSNLTAGQYFAKFSTQSVNKTVLINVIK